MMKHLKERFVAVNDTDYWDAGDIITCYLDLTLDFRGCISHIDWYGGDVVDALRHALNQANRSLNTAFLSDLYLSDRGENPIDMSHEYLMMMMEKAIKRFEDKISFVGTVSVGRRDEGYDLVPMSRESIDGLMPYPKTDVNPFRVVRANTVWNKWDAINPEKCGYENLIPINETHVDSIKALQIFWEEKDALPSGFFVKGSLSKEYQTSARFRHARLEAENKIN